MGSKARLDANYPLGYRAVLAWDHTYGRFTMTGWGDGLPENYATLEGGWGDGLPSQGWGD